MIRATVLACALFAAVVARADVSAIDDAGHEIRLPAPARRIVSLSPHATELLFAVGAGASIVGAVAYSDYPAEAKSIRRVGNSSMLDIEAIATLKPDLVVAWKHGNSDRHLERLSRLGFPTFYSAPPTLDRIADSLRELGRLTGKESEASRAYTAYRERLAAIRQQFAARPIVPIFYQVWAKPLMTVNGDQVLSDAMRACGARNVFESERMLVATVDMESVVKAAPEAIVTTSAPGGPDAFAPWRKLPDFPPTRKDNLLTLHTDALGRPSPRILDGVALLCDALEGVRRRRAA